MVLLFIIFNMLQLIFICLTIGYKTNKVRSVYYRNITFNIHNFFDIFNIHLKIDKNNQNAGLHKNNSFSK